MNCSILVCAYSLLFLASVAIKGAEIDIAGSLVDPLVLAVRLEAFMDDNCSKRKEKSVETGRMWSEWTFAFEQLLKDKLWIRQR